MSDTRHPQVEIDGYGYSAVVDEGIVDDVRHLWRRRVPTFASCQGDDSGSRYIGCAKKLTARRAHEIALRLGWVRHVVWHYDSTVFYAQGSHAVLLRANDGVLIMPTAATDVATAGLAGQ